MGLHLGYHVLHASCNTHNEGPLGPDNNKTAERSAAAYPKGGPLSEAAP